jgi:signal transduction histidine kinase
MIDLKSKKGSLILSMVVVAFAGVGLMTWLPSQMGRGQVNRIEQSAYDYIKMNAEDNLPEEAFLKADLFRFEWDRFVAEFLANGETLNVRAFDRNGDLIYATGRKKAEREEWDILSMGKKKLTEVGMTKRITSVYGNEEAVHAMRLYIPIHKNLQVLGVLEVVQDIDFIYKQVSSAQAGIGAATLLTLLVLSLMLYRAGREERDKLARENFRLSEYDADLSHRLRTSIASIKGFAATLQEGSHNQGEQQELLKIIVDESDVLNCAINDLFNLTGLESGRILLNKRPVRIDALMEEGLNKASKEAELRKVKFETRLPKEIYEVNVDEEKMVLALGNLLINSVMRSMAGGKVSLGAKYVKEGVQLEVKDDGEEVFGEEIPRLFEKFNWVERPGAQKNMTGLELPLVRAIVQAHSGKIGVESTMGRGAKFSFKLPVVESGKRG